MVLGSFWLFCLATFCGGGYAAVVLSFRFAAADCAPPERRPRALSAVMAGELGLSGTQMGLLLSAFSWTYAFSQQPVGRCWTGSAPG